jgi:hypothetical protein
VTQEPPQEHPIVVKLFGRSGSAAAYAIRDFLQRSDVPFEWHHLGLSNEENAQRQLLVLVTVAIRSNCQLMRSSASKISLMFLLTWRFIAFLLAALTLAMAFCHLLEMSPKMKDAADGLPQLWSSSRCGNRDGRSDFYHRARNTQSQGRISILSDSNYGVVLRGGIRHLVRTRVTHQCRNQRVDDHVRAIELDAVAQSVGAGARSTHRSLSGRI